jgi:hypothetical protein
MAEEIQNKNSASEDDLGTVHRLVTDGFKLKISNQVTKAKKSKKTKDIMAISLNDLNAAARWCSYNKIVGNAKSTEELSGVVDELEAIRRKHRGKKISAVGE